MSTELEIHHKNHNQDDNRRSNLMVLCKNCHAQIHAVEGAGAFSKLSRRINLSKAEKIFRSVYSRGNEKIFADSKFIKLAWLVGYVDAEKLRAPAIELFEATKPDNPLAVGELVKLYGGKNFCARKVQSGQARRFGFGFEVEGFGSSRQRRISKYFGESFTSTPNKKILAAVCSSCAKGSLALRTENFTTASRLSTSSSPKD